MEKYQVLFKRDVKTEDRKEYGEKRLYDRLKGFNDVALAKDFAFSNLPALLIETGISSDSRKYAVAGQFKGKYSTSFMGESESLVTYDVVFCEPSKVEAQMEEFQREGKLEKIILGKEVCIF